MILQSISNIQSYACLTANNVLFFVHSKWFAMMSISNAFTDENNW